MKHVTIPQQWDHKQALQTVAFLERVINAIWRAHGSSMAAALYAAETHATPFPRKSIHARPMTPPLLHHAIEPEDDF